METVRQEMENDSDNEEIFFGPITKREIVSKLKYHNLCKHELVEPLEVFQDNDILNENLIKFYEDMFRTGSTNKSEDENASEIPSSDSLSLIHADSLTECKLLQSVKDNEVSITDWKKIEDESALLNSTCSHNSTLMAQNERENNSLVSSYENSNCRNNSAENFNCTLEEMEMLMKFGESYINENRSIKPVDNISVESEKENDVSSVLNSFNKIDIKPLENNLLTPNTQSSRNSKEIESPLQSKENYLSTPNSLSSRGSKEPKLSFQSKENKISPLQNKQKLFTPNKPSLKPNSYTNKTYLKSPSPFKVSSRTIGKVSPGFKNIQSPIAMYIKNTARVPLVQNVAKATIESGTYKMARDSELEEPEGSEGMEEAGLPVRSYKRAPRAVLLSDEPEPALPPSIRRLIPGRVTPQVIKHVARTYPPSAPAIDNDLTILSTSQAQAQPDVSFYISKNAARTNRLQRHL